MKTEHTPGPWKVGYNRHVVQEEVGYICSVFNPYGQAAANARLIAAAPDLLEACIEAQELIRAFTAGTGETWELLNKAINKALGEK